MRSASRFAGTLGSLLVAATVWSTGASAGDETPPEILDEIRVTARQSETVVQEAPIAVSVMSGEDFERAYIVKLDNFTGYVPSLVVAKNDGAGRVVAIRGVGWETAQNLATQPGVLTYVDGVYLANPLALGLSLLDEVERIEVFRGPQGTEFGQSATGGAINIVTRPPDFSAAGGSVLLRVGDPTLLDLGVAANVPLAERLALRVSGHRLDRDSRPLDPGLGFPAEL
jgi:iron complex outermembrane receptor protein